MFYMGGRCSVLNTWEVDVVFYMGGSTYMCINAYGMKLQFELFSVLCNLLLKSTHTFSF